MEQNQYLSNIIIQFAQQSQQVYFIFDTTTNQFLYANPVFYQILESRPEQVANDPASLLTIIHPDDREYVMEQYQQLLASGEKKVDIEFKIITPNGTEKWILASPYLIEGENKTSFIAGTAEDISGKKQYIENLLKYTAKKNSVLEILSHDLAGPLNLLQSLTGLVASKVKPYENQELNNLLKMMAESCKRNVKLIREFVANEFLESSAVELNKQRINIVERLKQVMEEFKNAEDAILKNFVFISSNDPIYMDVDDMKFLQVINNLFSNAIKFTPDQGTITLTVEEKENTILFILADTGIGIPKEFQPVLFDKFSKARRPGLRGEESTGLGMSIIKTLVNWHGGNIWFESIVNKGTTFYIELPKE